MEEDSFARRTYVHTYAQPLYLHDQAHLTADKKHSDLKHHINYLGPMGPRLHLLVIIPTRK
jgi:hypothetical protein